MHVKLAYALSVAAPVAMLAGCSKKSDDEAGREAAGGAAPSAGGVRVAGAGRAAPSARRIAQRGRDKENGARLTSLTIEEIHVPGPTTGPAAGMAASRPAADRRMPDDHGIADDVPRPLSPLQFDSTKQRAAATARVATRSLVRTMDSDAVLTKVGRGGRNALAGDATRNPIRPGAMLAWHWTGQGTDAGKPDDGRLGMLPHDFKEATNTVLDVVTI
ncbi:amino acid-binding protein [Burkholderia sp. BCC0097]|uniref:amino acid-binding protein n=1 Tax=Burkholderia sp. BCC0097 TaxID=2676289 RepID=UPI00158CF502|nr:amino acid-binding protein [Burkholderia sp. BCC0097]